jgi:hypothetical protein
MRLLNVETLDFEDFEDEDKIPKYVILSHTWGEDEVSFQDMTQSRLAAEKKRGFGKIQKTASQARIDGIDWFWVDTCAIDKKSSAELSEAINCKPS